jgi:anti-sigma regulatory factor (Ser/Thr protein kinase)
LNSRTRIIVTGLETSLKFVLPSHPRYLKLIRLVVGELAAIHELPPEECRGLTSAVDEAVANVIRHAYRGDYQKPIEVTCQVFPDRLEFVLFDEGIAPDPARIAPHPLDDAALSGRGTHIIRSIMDGVSYEQASGRNILRLTKRLPARWVGKSYERHDP